MPVLGRLNECVDTEETMVDMVLTLQLKPSSGTSGFTGLDPASRVATWKGLEGGIKPKNGMGSSPSIICSLDQ